MNAGLIVLVFSTLLFNITAIPARSEKAGWECRNTDFEITCDDGACRASFSIACQMNDVCGIQGEPCRIEGACSLVKDFTPMTVYVGYKSMEVCAYSGCWNGTPIIIEDDTTLYVRSNDMMWSGSYTEKITFQLALDKGRRIAVLNGEGYAHPMLCQPLACGIDCLSHDDTRVDRNGSAPALP